MFADIQNAFNISRDLQSFLNKTVERFESSYPSGLYGTSVGMSGFVLPNETEKTTNTYIWSGPNKNDSIMFGVTSDGGCISNSNNCKGAFTKRAELTNQGRLMANGMRIGPMLNVDESDQLQDFQFLMRTKNIADGEVYTNFNGTTGSNIINGRHTVFNMDVTFSNNVTANGNGNFKSGNFTKQVCVGAQCLNQDQFGKLVTISGAPQNQAGNANMSNSVNGINFTKGWKETPDNVTDVAEISNDTDRYKTLMIVGNKSAGNERRVGIWDRLDVNGNHHIHDNLILDGDNSWIVHTPNDGRKIMYIAPMKEDKNGWNWEKQTRFHPDGSIDTTGHLRIGGDIYVGDVNGNSRSGLDKNGVVFGKELRLNGTTLDQTTLQKLINMANASIFDSSVILSDKHIPALQTLLQNRKLTLLYRGSRDGFDASNFHAKCDNIAPLFIVYKSTKNYIATGYCSVALKSVVNDYVSAQSGSCWLNNLEDNVGVIRTTKFLNTVHPQYSIVDATSHGPTFGGGHDLYMSNRMNAVNVHYTTAHSYAGEGYSGTALFGSSKFDLRDIEVFRVT